MIDRRTFSMGAGAMILGAPSATALEVCPAADMPQGTCSAMLDPRRFASMSVVSLQRQSQWCWAACIEMVCRWHGLRMSQESVVTRVYGGLANMPASDIPLTEALNARWISDDGVRFSIRARVFSAALGRFDVTNETIIRDLRVEQPLIVGARTHATVLARADYALDRIGTPRIGRVHVIDPFPGAAPPPYHARFLEADEMVPVQNGGSLRYLASVRLG